MDRREFLKWSGLGLAGVPALGAGREVSLEVAKDPVTQSAPVQWAIAELKKVVTVREGAPMRVTLVRAPLATEAYRMAPVSGGLRVEAGDVRGMVYALNELAQRGAQVSGPMNESPANPVRSVTRCFVSDVEDKPWYNDRAMWPEYLGMLAKNRFNRFSMAF